MIINATDERTPSCVTADSLTNEFARQSRRDHGRDKRREDWTWLPGQFRLSPDFLFELVFGEV
jgi:hypothetical protein